MSELKRLWQRAVTRSMDQRGYPAEIGLADGTVYWTDGNGVIHRDRVWVRGVDSANGSIQVVRCHKVTPLHGMPVRIDQINGVPTIIGADEVKAFEYTGGLPIGAGGPHGWQHGRLGPDPIYIAGLQFMPLLVHPTAPASMRVTVEQGSYRYNNVEKIWQTADSTDLTSYVPGSSTVQHFVIVALDRANNALVIVNGADIDATDPFGQPAALTPSDVLAITIADAYYPLAAILLYNGMTSITPPDIVMDLRLHGGEGLTTGNFVLKAGDTMTGQLTIQYATPVLRVASGGADQNVVIQLYDQATLKGRMIWAGANGAGSEYFGLINDAGDYLGLWTISTDIVFAPGNSIKGRVTSAGQLVILNGAIFNEDGGDNDFRVESDSQTHALFVNAGENVVTVGTSDSPFTPASMLVRNDAATIAIFQRDSSSQVTGMFFHNGDSTDNNGITFSFTSPTTGAGAVAGQQYAALLAIFDTHDHATRSGRLALRTVQSGTLATRATIGLGVQVASPSGGDPGAGALALDAHLTLDEMAATPSDPTAGAECRIYMKADKLVIQYNDASTIRYKYLELTGTGVTWVHTTSAP